MTRSPEDVVELRNQVERGQLLLKLAELHQQNVHLLCADEDEMSYASTGTEFVEATTKLADTLAKLQGPAARGAVHRGWQDILKDTLVEARKTLLENGIDVSNKRVVGMSFVSVGMPQKRNVTLPPLPDRNESVNMLKLIMSELDKRGMTLPDMQFNWLVNAAAKGELVRLSEFRFNCNGTLLAMDTNSDSGKLQVRVAMGTLEAPEAQQMAGAWSYFDEAWHVRYENFPGHGQSIGHSMKEITQDDQIFKVDEKEMCPSWAIKDDGSIRMTGAGIAIQPNMGKPAEDTCAARPGASSPDALDWNHPSRLAPVGCDLLIKLPNGSVVTAFRTSHLAHKEGQIEYRLPDDSLITGKFPWTYP